MPKFEIEYTVTHVKTYNLTKVVEAESEEKACDEVEQMGEDSIRDAIADEKGYDDEEYSVETTDVCEVEEDDEDLEDEEDESEDDIDEED